MLSKNITLHDITSGLMVDMFATKHKSIYKEFYVKKKFETVKEFNLYITHEASFKDNTVYICNINNERKIYIHNCTNKSLLFTVIYIATVYNLKVRFDLLDQHCMLCTYDDSHMDYKFYKNINIDHMQKEITNGILEKVLLRIKNLEKKLYQNLRDKKELKKISKKETSDEN